MYTLKNVKTFMGMEGHGFNASLYKDGKKVAVVIDSAYGGCYDYRWDNEADREPFMQYVKDVNPSDNKLCSDEIFISRLVDGYLKRQQFKRWCRKQTVFRLKGDKDGEYRTLLGKYFPASKKFLTDKYADKLEAIINEEVA